MLRSQKIDIVLNILKDSQLFFKHIRLGYFINVLILIVNDDMVPCFILAVHKVIAPKFEEYTISCMAFETK